MGPVTGIFVEWKKRGVAEVDIQDMDMDDVIGGSQKRANRIFDDDEDELSRSTCL